MPEKLKIASVLDVTANCALPFVVTAYYYEKYKRDTHARRASIAETPETTAFTHWQFMDYLLVLLVLANMAVCLLLAALWPVTIHFNT